MNKKYFVDCQSNVVYNKTVLKVWRNGKGANKGCRVNTISLDGKYSIMV